MANECYVTGKKTVHGRSRTHRRGVAGKRWRKYVTETPRVFKANLQTVTILENGKKKKVKVSSKVIKRLKFDQKKGNTPKISLVK